MAEGDKMLRVSKRKSKKRRMISGEPIYNVVVNGTLLKSSSLMLGPDRWQLTVDDEADSDYLTSFTFDETKQYFDMLYLAVRLEFWRHPFHMVLNFQDSKRPPLLDFSSSVEGAEWANPYSLLDYSGAVQSVLQKTKSRHVRFEFEETFDSSVLVNYACRLRSPNAVISDEIEYWRKVIQSIHEQAISSLAGNVSRDSLVALFCFPPSIRSACEQYLLYFAQFLEDLGIEADSEIKDDAGRVLFSVKPRDPRVALGRIREALEAYLELPRHPEFSTATAQVTNPAVGQLKSQVFFLQSQLELARATVQTKDAAIQALDFTVFQQRQLLTGGTQSNESLSPREDVEPIIG